MFHVLFFPHHYHTVLYQSLASLFVLNAEAFYEWETIPPWSLVFLHVIWGTPTKLSLNYFFSFKDTKEPKNIEIFSPSGTEKNMVTIHYKRSRVLNSGLLLPMQPSGYMHVPSRPYALPPWYLVARGTSSHKPMLILFAILWVIKSFVYNPGRSWVLC